jgi:hypothetical protein
MGEQNALAACCDDLLVGEFALRIGSFIVAMHGDHRRNDAELVKHPQLAHIASMEKKINAVQHIKDGRR